MPRTSAGVALFLTALAVAIASAGAPAAAQPAPARKAIVFVQGLATTLDTGTYTVVQERLAEPAWGYRPDDFLMYSYTGGSMQGRAWQPNPYPCQATTQDVDVSAQRLYELVRDYRAAHPETKLVVIAHSMGGLVTLHFIDKLLADPALASAVETIITNNSPLRGVPTEHILTVFGSIRHQVPDLWCGVPEDPLARPVVSQLVATAANPRTPADNAARVSGLQRLGVRFATLGSDTDCLFAPVVCLGYGSNAVPAQHLDGTLGGIYQGLYRRPTADKGPCLDCIVPSHATILYPQSPSRAYALEDVLRFIGPQGVRTGQ